MDEVGALNRLARAWGIKTRHTGVDGATHVASADALLAVLRALGAPVARVADAPLALREERAARWSRVLPPASAIWDGRPRPLVLGLPAAQRSAVLRLRVDLEDGRAREESLGAGTLRALGHASVDGREYVALSLTLPGEWPAGYHRVRLWGPGLAAETRIVSAPSRAAELAGGPAERGFGLFVPLYAAHAARGWGAGNFSDLATLARFTGELGGTALATLPLFAAFLDEPLEPSPYRPVSRLAWNEFYVDVEAVPELERDASARALLASTEFQAQLQHLRQGHAVDWKRGMALRRLALEALAHGFFSAPTSRLAAFERFLDAHPHLRDYARFRAMTELGAGAPEHAAAPDEPRSRYHAYVQWLAAEQLGAAAEAGRRHGVALYLDLPLGVHPEGFDAWREPATFVQGVSAGAPPDAFFPRGQDWGFAPPHPRRMREQGHAHFAACLRQMMRVAGLLRVDHVMSLHRLFCIPRGLDASHGVYVRYPAEELYAVLALESRRHGCPVVGEDLGLVPAEVRRVMARRGLLCTTVFDPSSAARGAAYLQTHDMPPFASFWHGLDIDEREHLGHLDPAQAAGERAARAARREALLAQLRDGGWLRGGRRAAGNVLGACLDRLAASEAPLVIVNLEDLWLETRGHNVPGTAHERPNWRGRTRYPLERLVRLARVRRRLGRVARRRRGPIL